MSPTSSPMMFTSTSDASSPTAASGRRRSTPTSSVCHGKWIDEDGDGRYDTLEIETRGFKGPRAIDISGIPLHEDQQTVVKERLYLDKADQNLLRNEITIIDNA